ncbi:MAG: ATP-binding protein [Bernardetiaceae bacterium]
MNGYRCFGWIICWIIGWGALHAQALPDSTSIAAQLQRSEEMLHRDPALARMQVAQALRDSRGIGFREGEVISLRLLGQLTAMGANYKAAIERYWQALNLAEQAQLPAEAARCKLYMAAAYRKLGRIETALAYSRDALKAFEKQGEQGCLLESLHELAQVYVAQQDYSKALFAYKRALGESLHLGDTSRIAEAYSSLGDIYLHMNELEQARRQIERAGFFYQAKNDQEGQMRVALLQAQFYQKQQQKQAVLKHLQQALNIAQTHRFPDGEQQTLWYLYQFYEQNGDLQQAFGYYKAYHDILDSISYQEQSQQIQQMETFYRLQREEEKYRLLAEQKQVQEDRMRKERSILFLLLLLTIATGFLSLRIYRSKSRLKRNKKTLEQQRQEILHQNERLQEINREKDGIISIVAHDLKSPLNKVEGFIQLLPLVGTLNPEQQSYIEQIKKITSGGKRLIRDLLDISDIEREGSKLEITAFVPERVVASILETFEERAQQKSIALTYDRNDEKETEILSDQSFMERILDNLLSNAIKFSGAGTEVRVRSWVSGSDFYLSVQDQGPGISPEDQQRMFKKFERLSAKPTAGESSTGLGLSIIKALVERLQGQIRVQSEVGKGTTFEIQLPIKSKT